MIPQPIPWLGVLLLAACSGRDQRPTAAVQPSVRITAANAVDVASAAYRTAFDPVAVARITTSFLEVPPPEPPAAPASATLVIQELEGPEGGRALFTWNDRDGDGDYSTGDAFTVVFADYGASGRVLTGAAAFADVAIQGDILDGLNWILSARLDLIGLQLTAGATTSTIDGTFRCSREQRATVRLLGLDAEADMPVGVRTLRANSSCARNDYVLDFTMGLFAEGSFDDPLLGGTLTFTTTTPMTGIQVLPDPATGEFTVAGADGSALTLVPLDYFTLEIQVDENGDGEPDATIPAEWAEL